MLYEPFDGPVTNASLRQYLYALPGVDACGLETRASECRSRTLSDESREHALELIIRMIDLTTLEGSDTPAKVRSLVAQGYRPDPLNTATPSVAAICVYGDMVPHAAATRDRLAELPDDTHGVRTHINIAAVATAFPSGRATRAVKCADTADAVRFGADEIDMVIDRGAFLSGDYLTVYNDIVAVKEACSRPDGTHAHLKVILETGELGTYDNVRRASWLSMTAGADFIKTSTGKISAAATLPMTLVMLEAVRDWFTMTGIRVGVKPAGGIRTTADALSYLVAVSECVGKDWLHPALFRFGASSLLDDVLQPIVEETRVNILSYANDPVSREKLDLAKQYGLFIDGEFHDRHGELFPVTSPSTGEVLTLATAADTASIDKAMGAAKSNGRRIWQRLTGAERATHLYRLAEVIAGASEVLSLAESLDTGRTITQTREYDARTVAEWAFSFAGWADKLAYAGIGDNPAPVGVVAVTVSEQCALLSLLARVAPALAAGNVVVISPAREASLSTLIFAGLTRDAGIPEGVVSVLTGGSAVARALVSHRDIDGVVLDYSPRCHPGIVQTVAERRGLVAADVRSVRTHVVCDDAPIDETIHGIVNDAFMNAGHLLCSGHIALVQENVYDDVIARLQARMRTLRVEDPLSKNSDVGSVSSEKEREKCADIVNTVRALGAFEWTAHNNDLPSDGHWYAPTVLHDVPSHAPILRGSTCGPLLAVTSFRTPDEAAASLRLSGRATRATIWSDKTSRAAVFADSIDAVSMAINRAYRYSPASVSKLRVMAGYGRHYAGSGLAPYLRNGASS